MNANERNEILKSSGLSSANCLLYRGPNPPISEFSFAEFWVRDKRDWPDYEYGPVHRVCADIKMGKIKG